MKQFKNNNVDLISKNDPLDKNRELIEGIWESVSVSYTHLTLPTNREV